MLISTDFSSIMILPGMVNKMGQNGRFFGQKRANYAFFDVFFLVKTGLIWKLLKNIRRPLPHENFSFQKAVRIGLRMKCFICTGSIVIIGMR